LDLFGLTKGLEMACAISVLLLIFAVELKNSALKERSFKIISYLCRVIHIKWVADIEESE
jgi:hypothetical protein